MPPKTGSLGDGDSTDAGHIPGGGGGILIRPRSRPYDSLGAVQTLQV